MQLISKLEIVIEDLGHQEILIAFADQIGLDGIEQANSGLIIHSDDEWAISQYIELIDDLPFISKDVVNLSTIPNENWNKTWESSFQPIRIDDFCGVRASFHEELNNVTHEIVINPELAFGTGHHETTYLMIQQMHHLDFTQKTVFDYGCGTAILSILAEQLGAKSIDAIDIEEQAIKCAADCLSINDVHRISLQTGSIDLAKGPYDITLANINRNVLMHSAERLFEIVNAGGLLLLSGVLIEDLPMVRDHYLKTGFELLNINQRGEWTSILFSH